MAGEIKIRFITKEIVKILKRLTYYFKLWFMMSKNAFLIIMAQRKVLSIFLVGKVLRFVFYLSFLYFLTKGAGDLAGYSSLQVIFFFLTFMIIDTTSQFFFREVYRFRPLVVSGDFDLIMVKPMSSLFRVLLGGADIIDLITIPPLYIFTYYVGSQLHPSPSNILVYFVMLFSGMLITTAFHIFVISFGIITLEVDHTVMIYRDLSAMGRFPVDIYKEPLKSILTFVVPVAFMMTFPAKALMGLIDFKLIILSLFLAVLFIVFSLRFWKFALTKYTSASS